MDELAHMTTSQVARKFGVLPSTVRKWVIDGKIRAAVTTPGGHYRFDSADINALINAEVSA